MHSSIEIEESSMGLPILHLAPLLVEVPESSIPQK